MLDAGDVEDGSRVGVGVLSWRLEFYILSRTRTTLSNFFYVLSPTPTFNSNFTRQPIVQHRHVLFAAVPVLHHVGLRRLAHGDEVLRPLREERQDVREVEHPKARVLPGDVEVREVVDGSGRLDRIPRADPSVCRADDESVELLPVSPQPERKDEKMPQHREDGAPRPARGGYRVES